MLLNLNDPYLYMSGRAMSRDSQYYSKPEHFIPERFLGEDGQLRTDILNPRAYAFGFGRR